VKNEAHLRAAGAPVKLDYFCMLPRSPWPTHLGVYEKHTSATCIRRPILDQAFFACFSVKLIARR
jgi:hypothetical protein